MTLSLSPIEDLIRSEWTQNSWPHTAQFTAGSMADRLGVHRRQVHYWRQHGLTVHKADVLAIRLGSHPAILWPEAWAA